MKVVCPHQDCGKSFISDFNLQRHLRAAHLKERPFQCPECFLTFGYRHVLLHHRVKKHPQPASFPLPSHVQSLSSPLPVPKLTDLLATSSDPVLGCYVHINHVYMFPTLDYDLEIPPLAQERRSTAPLPALSQVLGRKRRVKRTKIME